MESVLCLSSRFLFLFRGGTEWNTWSTMAQGNEGWIFRTFWAPKFQYSEYLIVVGIFFNIQAYKMGEKGVFQWQK